MKKTELPAWLESHGFEKDIEYYEEKEDCIFFKIIDSGTREFDWHLSVELGYANFFVLSIYMEADEGERKIELAFLNLNDRELEERKPNEIFAKLFRKGYEELVKVAGRTADLAMTGDV